jgi:hypothetical protein
MSERRSEASTPKSKPLPTTPKAPTTPKGGEATPKTPSEPKTASVIAPIKVENDPKSRKKERSPAKAEEVDEMSSVSDSDEEKEGVTLVKAPSFFASNSPNIQRKDEKEV